MPTYHAFELFLAIANSGYGDAEPRKDIKVIFNDLTDDDLA